MNDEWSAFLNENPADSAMSARSNLSAFCGLTDIGLLRVSGSDAKTFLQGQSTCDIAGLEPDKSGLGAFCNPKGRVIASFCILHRGGDYYFFLPADLVATIHKRLKLYVLRAKVSIEDLTGRRGLIGLFRPDTELPDLSALVQDDEAVTVGIGPGRRRFLIAAETGAAKRIWQALTASPDYRLVNSRAWHLRNIEEGLPSVTQATSEEFLPQMLNLDVLGGVSYRKGCYTGQEIVARTRFLGNLKRRMFRLRTLGERRPEPGDPLYRAGGAEGQRLGQVVAAAPEAEQGFQLLAVLPLDRAQNADLRLFRPDGPTVEFLPLPYTFEVP